MTSLEAVDILYRYLNDSELMTGKRKPNGGLYKNQRPLNSVSEDVVINALPLDREQLQYGIINVNIHVPNLIIKSGKQVDNTQPDYARLAELAGIASTLLDEVWHEQADYEFNVQSDHLLQDTDSSWYVNFRVEFRSVNL